MEYIQDIQMEIITKQEYNHLKILSCMKKKKMPKSAKKESMKMDKKEMMKKREMMMKSKMK